MKPIQYISNSCSNEYRFGFNGKEKDKETYGEGNEYDFGARIYNPRIGRWLSIDPEQQNFPSFTPYNFVINNPLIFIDPNGKHNVIYLVDFQKNGKNKININEIARQTRENLKAVGLDTEVIIWDAKKNGAINGNYIEKTDAIALFGSVEDIKNYARVNDIEKPSAMVRPGNKGFVGHERNAEETSGNLILINSDLVTIVGENLNNSKASDVAAFSIVHGFGHSMGLPDQTDPRKISFMSGGNTQILKGVLSNQNNKVNDIFKKCDNSFAVEEINKIITGGYPNEISQKKPKDNYQTWKGISNELKNSKSK